MTKTLKILLIILAILTVGLLFLIYYFKNTDSQAITNQSQAVEQSWNTYYNEEYKFTIDYPISWSLEEREQDLLNISFTSLEMAKMIAEEKPDATAEIRLSIKKNLENRTLEQFIEEDLGSEEVILSKSQSDIAGLRVFKYIISSMVEITVYYWTKDGSNIFILDALSGFDIQEKMIKSFQFWQTYQNEDLRFSFNYPDNWELDVTKESGGTSFNAFIEPEDENLDYYILVAHTLLDQDGKDINLQFQKLKTDCEKQFRDCTILEDKKATYSKGANLAGLEEDAYFFATGRDIIQFVYTYNNGDQKAQSDKQIFDRVVNSFQMN